MLDELEDQIAQLRVAYERYFLGIDRTPPDRERTKVERKIRHLSVGAMGSTALRFRLDGLRGRFVTYGQHWRRICTQIEKGTYVRVVAEAERRRRLAAFEARMAREQAQLRQQQGESPERDAAQKRPDPAQVSEAGHALLPPPPPAPKPSTKRPAKLANVADLPEARALYEHYVQAKRAAGQSTKGLSYSAMMQQIARQIPKLKAKHNGKVRFEVATKNGQVKLLAKLEKA